MHARTMRKKDLPGIIAITKENMTPIIRAAWNQDWDEPMFLKGLFEPGSRTKVMIVHSELVAYISYILHREAAMVFIWSMMVLKNYQHQGIGTSLMTMVEQMAKHKSYHAIELNVQSVNTIAFEFYTKLGFKTVEVIEVPGGKPDFRMRKELTTG